MKTITLQYSGPDYPAQGFLFYELVERFIFGLPAKITGDRTLADYLSRLRCQMTAAWYSNADDLKDFVAQALVLNQRHGTVTVRM